MFDREMFLLQAKLSAQDFDLFVEAGWIAVRESGQGFTESELGRVGLIRSLREQCGVNDEGVDVALRLLDQLHGARRALQQMAAVIRALPEPMRHEVLRALRGLPDDIAGRAPAGTQGGAP